jgi:hypothetical protein
MDGDLRSNRVVAAGLVCCLCKHRGGLHWLIGDPLYARGAGLLLGTHAGNVRRLLSTNGL